MLSKIPIMPDTEHFTPAQWEAIHLSGTNILVSASAGSGKTTVLTRRIIEKLKQGIRVDELLVCTFTDAATLEMKERIEKAIKAEINTQVCAQNMSLVDHLQEQLTLLPQAQISTIHGFCSKLIARHFEQIHIDPVFNMLTDETQIAMMKESVYEQVVEKFFDDDRFLTLMRSFSAKRTDNKIKELIIQLYDFSRSNSHPDAWLDRLTLLYEAQSLDDSLVYKELICPYVFKQIQDALVTVTQALNEVSGEKVLEKLAHILQEDQSFYQSIVDLFLQNASYDSVYRVVKAFSFSRMVGKMKDTEDYEGVIERAKQLRDQAKKQVEAILSAVFFADEAEQIKRLNAVLPVVSTLAIATKQFAKYYQTSKQEDNLVDYSDLEHYALDILMPLKEDGLRYPSSVAYDYQKQFHEIMVDEYQDVNRLQEAIIQAVSNGKNVFMVGDVKQSIYAFRLADPGLFLEKYHAYAKENADGVRIILKENFRSRGNVIHGTNLIFQQIMDESMSGMDYDDAAMLVQGNTSFPNDQAIDMSVLIFEGELAKEDNPLTLESATDGEIHMVAHEIQTLINNRFQVMTGNKQEQRAITYKDIVLLAPTKKNNVAIKEILESYGIPVVIQESDTYFKRTEIMTMLSLLRVIDNPYQDIPLVSVLRSPMVGLNDSQLAAIRINDQTSDYYRAVLRFVDEYRLKNNNQNEFYTNLYEKLVIFLERLNHWRYMATKESIVSLIWDIYDKTLFLDYVCGLPGGVQRQANLHALYDTAKAYEKTRFKGLFQFVQFIEKMQAKQQDIAQVPILSGGEDAVRVMTIHASKGLEFPVVFALDLAKQFNLQDIKGDTIFSEEYGIGTYYFDVDKKWKYPTLAHIGLKWFKQRKLLAEEMRKLYVALTRAKEKLILVGRASSKAAFFEQNTFLNDVSSVFVPQAKRENGSVTAFDWIGMALFRHQASINDYTLNPVIPYVLKQHPAQFHYQFYTLDDVLTGNQSVKGTSVVTPHNQNKGLRQQHHNLLGTYHYRLETKTASYQSVSELKRLVEDPIVRELNSESPTFRYTQDKWAVPKFIQEAQAITRADIGTATHLLLQSLDLSEAITLSALQQHAQQLVVKGALRKEVAEKIDYLSILRFFQTSFGQLLQQNAAFVRTEVPFSLIVSAKTLFSHISDEDSDVLIHGIIDGYFETKEGLVLYDYKTDYIGGQITPQTVVERYKVQLVTYANALATSLNKPIAHAYLVLLSTGDVIDVLSNHD